MNKILVINPGSTSTKIAVFKDTEEVFTLTIRHSAVELEPYQRVSDQYAFRKEVIIQNLKANGFKLQNFTAIVGRGGLIRPVVSGTYEVTEHLITDLRKGVMGEHASNLGGIISAELAASVPGCKAYISDPVVVDELEPVARVSGHPLFERKSIFHALNQKATARKFARDTGKKYEDLNVVVAHMGGGITIGAHKKGRVVDVNNGVDGYGPFSPERAGTIPAGDLAKLCFEGRYTLQEVKRMLNGQGGLMAHLGTNQAHLVQKKAQEGDPKSNLILSAMAYQVGKEIGSMCSVLEGEIDAILLTGGIANNSYVVDRIVKMVRHFAPVKIYPGEEEMRALAENTLRILNNEEACKIY
ncbi:butyrate kinase [Saccharicrinis sp. FJH54]|uniref:butyrate kinase n=1 Tax=Saccharicrinis sp. FJH54 TaxID=3344665 RepID=UPI0035D3DA87